MRILMHSIYFPPEVGGLETHVATLCKALMKRGHDVTVVTSHSIKSAPKFEVYDGIKVHRVFCPKKSTLGWTVTSIAAIPKVYSLSKDIDILHAHTFPSIVPCAPPAKIRKIPFVATIHTSHFLRLAKKAFWRKVLKFLLKKPDIILAPSKEIKDVCVDIAPNIKAYSLINAVDIERFKPTKPVIDRINNEKIIIVPRRLFEKNGVEYAIRALPLVREKVSAHLYLIGDGPLREKLIRLANELGITDFVHFLGAKPNKEMPGYLSSADVVVIPSLIEATSVAALEAMACERVVVASNVGGLPEIVTEKTGKLAQPGDPADLAEKIIEVLLMPDELKANLGRNAREMVVKNWSTDSLAEQVEKIYLEAIKRVRSR